ncbi:reticulon-1a isoform X1 [Chanos chanos]|uniref:Reticulon-1a isoform X1 n=1 Tax=Chanos chanos TaxID=29144 RepID=A0A6J2V6Z4_CHACN|nr:reticulon-1 isoform X1 [Chanos chanos]
MSAKSSEESGLEGKWFGEEYERNGLYGSTRSHFDDTRDDVQSKGWEDELNSPKQQLHQFDNERKGPSVAMETASTDDSLSDMFLKSSSRDEDLYTSLLSSKNNPFSGGAPLFPTEPNRSPPAPAGTDSGIGMTPGDPSDLHTALQGSHKTEAYNYMDISHSGDSLSDFGHLQSKKQQQHAGSHFDDDLQDHKQKSSMKDVGESDLDPFDLGRYLEKSPPGQGETKGNLGSAGGQHSFPYVEDPSDEEASDYRSYRMMGTPQTASPVKITVTAESRAQPGRVSPQGGLSERESVLSFGQQGVPTVTLSEPEDDSAASSANHSPTGRESPSDILFQPAGMRSGNSAQEKSAKSSSSPRMSSGEPVKPTSPWDMSGFGARNLEGSGDESGDSEIEQVAEEPDSPKGGISPKTQSSKGSNPFEASSTIKGSFGQASNPFEQSHTNKENVSQANNPFEQSSKNKRGVSQSGNPSAPLYSLLREEREAELDSDLLIESASEESPKREQGFSAPKLPDVTSTSTPSLIPSSPVPTSRPLASAPVTAEPPSSTLNDKQPLVNKTTTAQAEDSWSIKPRPAATGTSVSVKEPAQQEWESKSRGSTEGKNEVTVPLVLQGFNKQKAIDLLYWRDVKQSGLLFGSVLLLLFSLTQFSVVSVVAYLALAALSATISFRVYKSVLQAVQKTDEGHPFKSYLEVEIALSPEQISKYVDKAQLYVNCTLKELRRLFLVQDLVDSIKFAVLMWLLTYVGAIFNGLTLLILAVVSMFTMPVVYEKYQTQIDQYLGLVRTQVNSIMGKIREKVPGAKRKDE